MDKSERKERHRCWILRRSGYFVFFACEVNENKNETKTDLGDLQANFVGQAHWDRRPPVLMKGSNCLKILSSLALPLERRVGESWRSYTMATGLCAFTQIPVTLAVGTISFDSTVNWPQQASNGTSSRFLTSSHFFLVHLLPLCQMKRRLTWVACWSSIAMGSLTELYCRLLPFPTFWQAVCGRNWAWFVQHQQVFHPGMVSGVCMCGSMGWYNRAPRSQAVAD